MQFSLTNAGKEYLAKVNAGGMAFHLTRAVTGSGSSASLEILAGVVDEKQQIQLEEVRAEGEYTHIVCVLTNLEWEQEYVLRQIGLYAADGSGQESLVIIGQDPYGDRIPSIHEKEVEYQYNIGMRVSNAAEVTFDFSVNDFLRKKYFYGHLEEFEDYKKGIQGQFEALPRVRVGPAALLDRKDTLLLETLPGTGRITKVRERDGADQAHVYDFAASFTEAASREELRSGDTLGELFGLIKKYFSDLKPGVYKEADDPFTLMTVSTYRPVPDRTKGSLYGLVTKERGIIVVVANRYVVGTESPLVKKTLYLGENKKNRTPGSRDDAIYKMILHNLVHTEPGQTVNREPLKLYAETKTGRG